MSTRTRKTVEVTCAVCKETRSVRADSASKVAVCGGCQRKAAAAKGYAATVSKHGPAAGAAILQAHRLAHPSNLELIVQQWLNDLAVEFEREAIVGQFLVDFRIDHLLIEVDGHYFHTLAGRQERDAWREQKLTDAGFTLLRLSEAAIQSGEAQHILKQRLGG